MGKKCADDQGGEHYDERDKILPSCLPYESSSIAVEAIDE
jgi:hypothetical protein